VDVLLGNGGGTFGSPITYSSGGFDASSVAVADVNADGKPDLLVTDVCADAGCKGLIAMLLGNGDGTFQAAVVRSSGGYFANSVALTDVNGDGKPDIVVAHSCTFSIAKNCGTGAVGVLLGYGNGIFQQAVTYGSGGFGAFSLAVLDVSGDGKPDAVATNEAASGNADGSVGVLLNNTAPTIPTTTTLMTSPNPSKYQQIVTLTAMVTSASGPP
jgi:FG-GAP-like repeat